MSEANTHEDMQCPPRVAWWTCNVYFVCLFLSLWLILTIWGSLAIGDSSISASRFLLSAQWVPLSYLALVVVYGIIMNRFAAKHAQLANGPNALAGQSENPISVIQDA